MILRDKNNFPINLGDIVVIHQDGILYGTLGLIISLSAFEKESCVQILLSEESDIFLDNEVIEVIDNLESTIFDGFDTKVTLPFHQASLVEIAPRRFDWKNIETKRFLRKFEKQFGYVPTPRRFPVIAITWSERGRGSGEYEIWQDTKDGKIYINTECDSKESVKRILCQMIDQATIAK